MLAAVTSLSFCMADVECGVCDLNKNNRANATHGPSPVQKMFRDRMESMLDRRGPGTGPGPVLTLDWMHSWHSLRYVFISFLSLDSVEKKKLVK